MGARCRPQDPAQKHLLRYAYEVGKTTWYRETVAVDLKIKAGVNTVDRSSNVEVVFRAETKSVTHGKATLQCTFTRVKAKDPLGEYDSVAGGSPPDVFRQLADVVDQWIELRVDECGRITDVSTSPAFPERVPVLGIDRQHLEPWLVQTMLGVPDAPVAVGDKWYDESLVAVPPWYQMKSKTTTTFVAAERGLARLHQQYDVPPVEEPGRTTTVDKSEGDVALELATGTLVTSTRATSLHVTGQFDLALVATAAFQRIDPPAAAAGKDH